MSNRVTASQRRNNVGRIAWGLMDRSTGQIVNLQPNRDTARRVARTDTRNLRAVRLVPARA